MVLAGEEQLQTMNDAEVQKKISLLKCPRFWRCIEKNKNDQNSGTNFFRGRVQWGYLYHNDCELCKIQNECKGICKHKSPCELYYFVNEKAKEIVKVKRVNVNAKLQVRGTEGAAGYDLAAAQAAVVSAHGNCLVKTGLAMALPPRCYGRVAPQSGLALTKSIDIGARVIDSDYRGEVGVILFNVGSEDFIVNMGDRIAQLIFEKIKTPIVKEMNELEGTDRGVGCYGSTGMKVVQVENDSGSKAAKDKMNDGRDTEMK